MRIAYLVDKRSVGGGMEYVRRQIAAHPNDECRVFEADRGECTVAAMNAWGAEIVHANHIKALLQLFRNPFARLGGYLVFTVHGIHLRKYDFLPRTLMNRMKRLLRLLLERWLYRKCDRIIALTETDACDICRLYGRGLPVVIEPNSINADGLAAPRDLRYRQDEFAFCCIGRFDLQKGQDVLVEAIAVVQNELRARREKVLFIGDGPAFAGVRRLADDLGVSDIAVFAGEISDAGVYMTCAKVLIAPSRWEGMPYLLLEAVARGRRIIASDCPGNRDVLKDYGNAVMFPVEDSRSLSHRMGKVHPSNPIIPVKRG